MRNSKKVTVKGRNIVDLVFIVDKSKKNVACELCETAKHLENHIVFHIFSMFFPMFHRCDELLPVTRVRF